MTNASRRDFLTWSALAAAAWGMTPSLRADEIGPDTRHRRRDLALKIRIDAARRQAKLPLPAHPDNGDEDRYPNKIGSYSKCLPHDAKGEVDRRAYKALVDGLSSGNLNDVVLGGTTRLANPQGAYAFHLEGPDSHQLAISPAPAFAGAVEALEMGELYWQALTRDIPFAHYENHPLIKAAVKDLSYFGAAGVLSPQTIFRGPTPGDRVGPYISQFLYLDVPLGPYPLAQRIRTTVPGDDHLTTFDKWLDDQKGRPPSESNTYDPVPRYLRTSRDLAMYLRIDFTFQAGLNAALILLGMGAQALDSGNPYVRNLKESGFVTFGASHILDLASRCGSLALKAAWYQKWLVHRRLRPDAFAARVQIHASGKARYPIHDDLLKSAALDLLHRRFGTFLLPQAYAEGVPCHPSYPAGHAALSGAFVTMLKAFFKSDFVIPNPVVPNEDGTALVAYTGPALTVGGELDKLASNMSIGRDAAGVHWRSDAIEGMALGEAVALGILRDEVELFTEPYRLTLTKFNGETVTIKPGV